MIGPRAARATIAANVRATHAPPRARAPMPAAPVRAPTLAPPLPPMFDHPCPRP
jgi:hypothetical protein